MKTTTPGKRVRKPTPLEQRQHHAATGNVEAIWQELTTADPSLLDGPGTHAALLQALEVAAQKDPEQLAGYLLGKMVALTGFAVLRTHHLCRRAYNRHDRGVQGNAQQFPPRELERELLPGLLQLQTHTAELLEAQARIARLWRLGRKPAPGQPVKPSLSEMPEDASATPEVPSPAPERREEALHVPGG